MERGKVLIVFAKAPRAGRVKTRLAAGLGPEGALRIYRRMAEGIWGALREAQARGAFALWLCFDPPEAESEIRSWLEGADRYLPQTQGNLGRRLAIALTSASTEGYEKVAVIGTDAPAATPARIHEAFSKLVHGRVVFGPALDGGFYLMAVAPPVVGMEDLLEETPWSSSDTLAAIVGGVRGLGLGVVLIPEALDIDTLEDLEAHRRSPEGVGFPL